MSLEYSEPTASRFNVKNGYRLLFFFFIIKCKITAVYCNIFYVRSLTDGHTVFYMCFLKQCLNVRSKLNLEEKTQLENCMTVRKAPNMENRNDQDKIAYLILALE